MIQITDLNLNFYILKPILLFKLVEQFKKKYIDFIEFLM